MQTHHAVYKELLNLAAQQRCKCDVIAAHPGFDSALLPTETSNIGVWYDLIADYTLSGRSEDPLCRYAHHAATALLLTEQAVVSAASVVPRGNA
jgi:hypothetical protein